MSAAARSAPRLSVVESPPVHDIESIYREQFPFVWRSARRLGVDAGSLEDVAQEVFVVASRRLDDFEGRASMRTWLFGITLRVVQGYRRGSRRRDRKHEALKRAGSDGHEDPYARADAAQTLLALVQELPRKYRTAYILGELEGMTAAEIADALDVKPSTAYSRLREARKRIEAAVAVRLEQEGEGR